MGRSNYVSESKSVSIRTLTCSTAHQEINIERSVSGGIGRHRQRREALKKHVLTGWILRDDAQGEWRKQRLLHVNRLHR
jgi:hypothetical protein